MSLFFNATATCGQCDTAGVKRLAGSVNADNRPDLRAEILAGEFQAITCANCGTRLRLPVHLSYLDMGRGNWILAEAVEQVAEWREVEAASRAIFDQCYGLEASPMAQGLARGLRPRLVFGWAALREKLLCDDLGLDDVVVELVKLTMLRTIPGAIVNEDRELRLVGGEPDELHFVWIDSETESYGEGTAVPRDIIAEIELDPEPWREFRARLSEGIFVDLRRLFFA
jgi:CpXC protein